MMKLSLQTLCGTTMQKEKKKHATTRKSVQKDAYTKHFAVLFRQLFKSISDCVEALMLCLGIALGNYFKDFATQLSAPLPIFAQ